MSIPSSNASRPGRPGWGGTDLRAPAVAAAAEGDCTAGCKGAAIDPGTCGASVVDGTLGLAPHATATTARMRPAEPRARAAEFTKLPWRWLPARGASPTLPHVRRRRLDTGPD